MYLNDGHGGSVASWGSLEAEPVRQKLPAAVSWFIDPKRMPSASSPEDRSKKAVLAGGSPRRGAGKVVEKKKHAGNFQTNRLVYQGL